MNICLKTFSVLKICSNYLFKSALCELILDYIEMCCSIESKCPQVYLGIGRVMIKYRVGKIVCISNYTKN
jgi:hypothetical protein